MTADELVSIVRSKGNDTTDPRDAAHEACHALTWKVRKPWTRDNINERKPKIRSNGIRDEVLARAVEQLVCKELGVDCGSVEKWAHVCWMETLKNERISLPTNGWLEKCIVECMGSYEAKLMTGRIMRMRARQ